MLRPRAPLILLDDTGERTIIAVDSGAEPVVVEYLAAGFDLGL
jgi:hypothetical protein